MNRVLEIQQVTKHIKFLTHKVDILVAEKIRIRTYVAQNKWVRCREEG